MNYHDHVDNGTISTLNNGAIDTVHFMAEAVPKLCTSCSLEDFGHNCTDGYLDDVLIRDADEEVIDEFAAVATAASAAAAADLEVLGDECSDITRTAIVKKAYFAHQESICISTCYAQVAHNFTTCSDFSETCLTAKREFNDETDASLKNDDEAYYAGALDFLKECGQEADLAGFAFCAMNESHTGYDDDVFEQRDSDFDCEKYCEDGPYDPFVVASSAEIELVCAPYHALVVAAKTACTIAGDCLAVDAAISIAGASVVAASVVAPEPCQGFGVEVDGVCDYSSHSKTSMIRCSGDEHFRKWHEQAKKRTGKQHAYIANVSWVEYFKHEYAQNYGKRPAEGPSGFGGMYVPGKPKECEKVRDLLNGIFHPPAWTCTPVCLNKFNRKSKCQDKSRRDRRIRRLHTSNSLERYTLMKHVDGDPALAATYLDSAGTYKMSLVGRWKDELKAAEDGDVITKWRKDTVVVGLDFTDCECQTEGDSHLTYGAVPDENGDAIYLNGSITPQFTKSVGGWGAVEVGAKGSAKTPILLSDITLNGKHTFSCNSVTNEISSFQFIIDRFDANFNHPCMDVCHETVKMLRTLEDIQIVEENDTYTPFYISMAVLIPIYFLCCLITTSDGKDICDALYEPLVLTCKFFDWASDWAFMAVSLRSARFTETSTMGYYQDNTYQQVQKASLVFCIFGTVLVFAESYAIGAMGSETRLFDMNKYTLRSLIGIGVIILEDIPQLSLCGVYLNAMHQEVAFKASSDPLTFISILLSSISLLYNLVNVCVMYDKGQRHS
jgi:hypothetical protein